jgi:predicted Zn-dependent protease
MNLLRDLFAPRAPAPAGRLLTREESQAIATRVLRLHRGKSRMRVSVESTWRGDVRWGRNRLTATGDRRSIQVKVQLIYGHSIVEAVTSRVDDEGLADVVTEADRLLHDNGVADDPDPLPPRLTDFPRAPIWSDATLAPSPEARAELAERLLRPAADAGLWSAGYLALGAESGSWFGQDGEALYCAGTRSQCSITVRSKEGGSGWAGVSSHDWATIDPVALEATARAKCEASRSPSALEPGRYAVVLEPQAVADLLDLVMQPFDRPMAEAGMGPYADPKRPGFSKLGQRLLDARLDVRSDPEDPQLGVCPFDQAGEPLRATGWFQRGVLMALSYDRRYGVGNFNENRALPHHRQAVRMTGGETTVAQMIASTRRGLLVTRFSGINVLDFQSLLSTGHTRDGLWLIENGKVTRPVKNFRFTDSPLFILNSVESVGTPVPVFHPDAPMMVPPLKASSLNFTRLVDAV